MATYVGSAEGQTAPPAALIQWRALFAGALVALGLFVVVSLLWVALAYGSGVTYFATNLSWWVGITAIVSFPAGAYVMGWLGGNNRYRGWGAGLVNPVAMWGLLVIATTLAGVPALVGSVRVIPDVRAGASLWAMFWSLGIGLVTAIIGALAGGSTPRTAATYEQEAAPESGSAPDQRFRAAG
jgi:hypothetical protein